MRRGCVGEEQLANGKMRHRIHTQVIKGRDLGGEPERWTVIEEVAQAFALVGALVDDELPFARRGRGFRGRYRTFLRWVNGPGAQAFLAPIPSTGSSTPASSAARWPSCSARGPTACWPARST
jgi:hypothetical protein